MGVRLIAFGGFVNVKAAEGERDIESLRQQLGHSTPERVLKVGSLGLQPGGLGFMLGDGKRSLRFDTLQVEVVGPFAQRLGVIPGLFGDLRIDFGLGKLSLGVGKGLGAGTGLHEGELGLGCDNGGIGLGGSGLQQAVVDGKQRLAGNNRIAFGHRRER